jgi:hypothetical protein
MDNQTGSVESGNPAGAAPAGQQAPWYQEFPEDVRGFVENKGWKGPTDAISGYINLEKFLGADKAGRGLVLPKDENSPEWDQVYDRLGRPKSPADYKLPIPDNDTGEFAKVAAETFHKLGLTSKQAAALTEWYNTESQEKLGAQMEQSFQKSEVELSELQREWGPQFDANVAAGQRAAAALGIDPDTLSKIENVVGTKQLLKAFTDIGKMMAEDSFVEGEGNTKFGVSPEAARARIRDLQSDREWTSKYLGGNADAKAEMQRLMRIAYPE